MSFTHTVTTAILGALWATSLALSDEPTLLLQVTLGGFSGVAAIMGSIGSLYNQKSKDKEKVQGQDIVATISSALVWAIIIVSSWAAMGNWSPTMVIASAFGGMLGKHLFVWVKKLTPYFLQAVVKKYFNVELKIPETKKIEDVTPTQKP